MNTLAYTLGLQAYPTPSGKVFTNKIMTEPKYNRTAGETIDKILAAIRPEGSTNDDIADDTDIPLSTVTKVIVTLRKNELIESKSFRSGKGYLEPSLHFLTGKMPKQERNEPAMVKEMILAAIKEGVTTYADLALKLKYHPERIKFYCGMLKHEGLIEGWRAKRTDKMTLRLTSGGS